MSHKVNLLKNGPNKPFVSTGALKLNVNASTTHLYFNQKPKWTDILCDKSNILYLILLPLYDQYATRYTFKKRSTFLANQTRLFDEHQY